MSFEDASASFTKSVYIILKPHVLIHLFRSVIALVGPHVLQIGVLSRSKISHHWARIIPEIYHEAIARLFDQLGVMVPIDSERFLVPSLLPECKPDLEIMEQKEATTVLRRSFLLKTGVTLPLGAIGHMIAATIRWNEGGKVTSIWRGGCVVAREDITFSVRTDRVFDPPQEGIHITVSAKQRGKDVTFAFLHFQSVIRNLFTNFYNLEYLEIIPYDVGVSDWTTLDAVVDAREKNSNVVTWIKNRGKVWLSQICPDILCEDMILRIPKDRIQFMETLKSRDDGRVIKASIPKSLIRRKFEEMEISFREEERVLAVVRLTDEKLTSETILTANREAYIMASLKNPYILSLYGVCTDYQTPLLITEYMDHGDLRTFLEDPLSLSRKLDAFLSSWEQKRQKHFSCPMEEVLQMEAASLHNALEKVEVSEVKDAVDDVIIEADRAWRIQGDAALLFEMRNRVCFPFLNFLFFLVAFSSTLCDVSNGNFIFFRLLNPHSLSIGHCDISIFLPSSLSNPFPASPPNGVRCA